MKNRVTAFTLVELLVVIGVIALLISILLPALNAARRAGDAVACLSNMAQIRSAIFAYAAENDDVLPWAELSYTTSGDSVVLPFDDMIHRQLSGSQSHDQLLSPYAATETGVLVCPSDDVERVAFSGTPPAQGLFKRSYALVRSWGPDASRGRNFRGAGGQIHTSDPVDWQAISRALCVKRTWFRKSSYSLMLVEAPTRYNIQGSWGAFADRPLDHWGGWPVYQARGGNTTHGKKWNYLFADGHCESLDWQELVLPPLAPARPPVVVLARTSEVRWLRSDPTEYNNNTGPLPVFEPLQGERMPGFYYGEYWYGGPAAN